MQKSQIEDRDNEGGQESAVPAQPTVMEIREEWLKPESTRITLLPPFEHKEPVDDDLGLPEHPIYSNYTKYLWKGHRRSGGVEIGGPFVERS
jgi:hypothetical protein